MKPEGQITVMPGSLELLRSFPDGGGGAVPGHDAA